MEDHSILSPSLKSQLGSFNFWCLAQMKVATRTLPLLDLWYHSSDLQLMGPLATEWDSFIAALKCAKISLIEAQDSFLWARGDAFGIITVKNL
jgi:hypothetical protein